MGFDLFLCLHSFRINRPLNNTQSEIIDSGLADELVACNPKCLPAWNACVMVGVCQCNPKELVNIWNCLWGHAL